MAAREVPLLERIQAALEAERAIREIEFPSQKLDLEGLISMLTAGADECRAWPVPRGTPAPRAAGKIHSDIERCFIRAEVVAWQDLVELGPEAKCRDAGKLRVEEKGV